MLELIRDIVMTTSLALVLFFATAAVWEAVEGRVVGVVHWLRARVKGRRNMPDPEWATSLMVSYLELRARVAELERWKETTLAWIVTQRNLPQPGISSSDPPKN